MKIVVIGGTGMIGTQLVKKLGLDNHNVIAAAPNKGIDTITGEGLENALKDADVVIDVSNSPVYNESIQFFKASGNNLVAASKKAGVKHLIILSVVGTPKLTQSDYFLAKDTQESIVRNSGIPYTIIRATQFYEFMRVLADLYNKDGMVHLIPAVVQPIASRDVAFVLAETALSSPLNDVKNIAGPQRFSLPEIVSQYLQKVGDDRKVVADLEIGYDGVVFTEDRLTPESTDWTSSQTFDSWFEENIAVSLKN